MASSKKQPSPSINVDHRVAIALEALSGVERLRVESTLRDPSGFAPKVPKSPASTPIHALKADGSLLVRAVDPSLRIVFSREGDRVHVVDLVRQETLDRFAKSETLLAQPDGNEGSAGPGKPRPSTRKPRP